MRIHDLPLNPDVTLSFPQTSASPSLTSVPTKPPLAWSDLWALWYTSTTRSVGPGRTSVYSDPERLTTT